MLPRYSVCCFIENMEEPENILDVLFYEAEHFGGVCSFLL